MAAAVSTEGQALYAQPVPKSPAALLKDKGVPLAELDKRTQTAAQEESGDRTVIDPTRSLGAGVDAPGDPGWWMKVTRGTVAYKCPPTGFPKLPFRHENGAVGNLGKRE